MEINPTITISLSEDDLKNIVKKFIEETVGYDITMNISFNIGKKTVGYGMNEHPVEYFEGCTIQYKGK